MRKNRMPASALAYESAGEMLFGVAKHPVRCSNGVVIGGGPVLPEVNFTLPPMLIREETLSEVRERFTLMARHILERSVELQQPSIVLEFEQLFELTQNPDWGALVTADLKAVMSGIEQSHGLKSVLRVTVADIRDQERPPHVRTGKHIQTMRLAFEKCADAGADILSIESTGGKEVSDQALMQGDLEALTFAMGVLAPRDMEQLWSTIVDVARLHGAIAGGDTACGFANTAMQLAHQNMLPRVLAAVVRLMCAPRSLVAVEMGAVGPLKDCGYENPVLKAITGVPISMEGKSSACAHSSPLGNIAAAVCDLWSNESVQDVRLLAGFAPEVFSEILIYDCRLMNTASSTGYGPALRDMLTQSDLAYDPQALMLDPEVVFPAASKIIEAGPDHYRRTRAVTRFAVDVLRQAVDGGGVKISPRDERWLSMMEETISALPEDENVLRERVDATYGSLYLPSEYGLGS